MHGATSSCVETTPLAPSGADAHVHAVSHVLRDGGASQGDYPAHFKPHFKAATSPQTTLGGGGVVPYCGVCEAPRATDTEAAPPPAPHAATQGCVVGEGTGGDTHRPTTVEAPTLAILGVVAREILCVTISMPLFEIPPPEPPLEPPLVVLFVRRVLVTVRVSSLAIPPPREKRPPTAVFPVRTLSVKVTVPLICTGRHPLDHGCPAPRCS